jgi:hypothetical protein
MRAEGSQYCHGVALGAQWGENGTGWDWQVADTQVLVA